MQIPVTVSPVPNHIPQKLVVDFDIYNLPDGNKDLPLAWKERQNQGPRVFWTPRNGGHWVATRADDIIEMQKNHALFSHSSCTIPANKLPNLPLESDPPYHTELRAVISPMMAPKVLKRAEIQARELSQSLIEGFRPDGQVEFTGGFARRVPIYVFLNMVEMPFDDAPQLLAWSEIRVRSPDENTRNQVVENLFAYLSDTITERRANPGEDFISQVVTCKIGERDVNELEALNMLGTLMFGGLDTVASMMGFFMRFLANSPQHRKQLLDTPDIIPHAVNELIRRHGIVNTARTITQDIEYQGAPLRAGDKIIVPNGLVGLDDDKFTNPLEVDFKRPDASQHAAFGNGPHRCPGANIARMELKIMLEEWLPRIPDFHIDGKVIMSPGLVNCLSALPLAWKT